MKIKLPLFSLFAALIISASCNCQDKPKNFDYGHVEKNQYKNSYFDFTLELPSDWIVQTKEQMEQLTKTGKEIIAGDDKNIKASLKAAEVNTANLLSVFQYELGAAVQYNPSVMLVAENIKNMPGIKSGKDYLFHARKFMEQSQLKYDHLDKDFINENISNRDFYLMNASLTYAGTEIKQMYYTTVLKGFALNVIISYHTEDQKQSLQKIVESVKFKD